MNIYELIDAISEDLEFIKSLAALKDQEKVYNALKEKGLTDSFEEFKKVADEMSEKANELDAADIDAIVGGGANTAGDVAICASPGLILGICFVA